MHISIQIVSLNNYYYCLISVVDCSKHTYLLLTLRVSCLLGDEFSFVASMSAADVAIAILLEVVVSMA